MNKPTSEELRKQYMNWETEALIEIFQKHDTLTELALSVVQEELRKRGIMPETIPIEKGNSKLSNTSSQTMPRKHRKWWIAGLLSLLVPGLGQVYNA